MKNSITKKSFSTAWLIVVGCMLIQAIPFGVASNIQPQFVSYVVEENGFTLASFSLIFTLGTFASAIASPFIGVLFDKISTKLMFISGCFLSGGGFLAFSMCQELWQFYLVSAVVQIGTAIISSIGIPLLINRWFDEESKGKALGIAFAGSGLGNIFLQQLVASSLSTNGASKSYLIFGLLSLLVGIPVSFLLLRLPKNENEILKSNKNSSSKSDNNPINLGFSFKEVLKLKYFWIFGFALFFLGMYVSALSVQYAAYMKTDLSLEQSMIGTVGSIFAFCCLFGNLFGGSIFDKLGVTKGLVVAFILAGVSCLSLIFAKQIPKFTFIFAAFNGLSVFAYMIGPSLLTGSFFGQKDFGAILGVVQIFFAVGFAAGSSIFGLLVDSFGYTIAWSCVFVFITICYLSLISTSIGINKLNKVRQNNLKSRESLNIG